MTKYYGQIYLSAVPAEMISVSQNKVINQNYLNKSFRKNGENIRSGNRA